MYKSYFYFFCITCNSCNIYFIYYFLLRRAKGEYLFIKGHLYIYIHIVDRGYVCSKTWLMRL